MMRMMMMMIGWRNVTAAVKGLLNMLVFKVGFVLRKCITFSKGLLSMLVFKIIIGFVRKCNT